MKRNPQRSVEMARKNFEQGNNAELLRAIVVCGDSGIPLPPWVVKAIGVAYRKARDLEIRSWDEVFGRPVPKGTHVASARKKPLQQLVVRLAVDESRCAGEAVDEALFEEVGKRLGMGKTKASKLYYSKLTGPNDQVVRPVVKLQSVEVKWRVPRISKNSRKYKPR